MWHSCNQDSGRSRTWTVDLRIMSSLLWPTELISHCISNIENFDLVVNNLFTSWVKKKFSLQHFKTLVYRYSRGHIPFIRQHPYIFGLSYLDLHPRALPDPSLRDNTNIVFFESVVNHFSSDYQKYFSYFSVLLRYSNTMVCIPTDRDIFNRRS